MLQTRGRAVFFKPTTSVSLPAIRRSNPAIRQAREKITPNFLFWPTEEGCSNLYRGGGVWMTDLFRLLLGPWPYMSERCFVYSTIASLLPALCISLLGRRSRGGRRRKTTREGAAHDECERRKLSIDLRTANGRRLQCATWHLDVAPL